jgi:hypothetical protein
MDEWLGRLLTITYPVVIVCGSGLLAYWMKLRHERRQQADTARLEELAAKIEVLRGEMELITAEFSERLDFTERLLTRDALPRPAEPQHPTPV